MLDLRRPNAISAVAASFGETPVQRRPHVLFGRGGVQNPRAVFQTSRAASKPFTYLRDARRALAPGRRKPCRTVSVAPFIAPQISVGWRMHNFEQSLFKWIASDSKDYALTLWHSCGLRTKGMARHRHADLGCSRTGRGGGDQSFKDMGLFAAR